MDLTRTRLSRRPQIKLAIQYYTTPLRGGNVVFCIAVSFAKTIVTFFGQRGLLQAFTQHGARTPFLLFKAANYGKPYYLFNF